MKTECKLIGLSRPNSATLTTMESEEIFWATTDMTPEKFNEMWNYCDGNWKINKIALVEHEGFSEDGTPQNPVMLGFREEGSTPFKVDN